MFKRSENFLKKKIIKGSIVQVRKKIRIAVQCSYVYPGKISGGFSCMLCLLVDTEDKYLSIIFSSFFFRWQLVAVDSYCTNMLSILVNLCSSLFS